MKKLNSVFIIMLSLFFYPNFAKTQIFENYSVYSFAPGISSSRADEQYRGISLTANAAAGTGFFHVELSSTLGYGKELFINEYLTLDAAVGVPFVINENSEALIALSPFSLNLTMDGNIGLATLLKYRYGKLFLESKLVLSEYKKKSGEPFLLNNSYFGVRRRIGDIFGAGIRYTSFSKDYNYVALFLSWGFEEN